MDVTAIAFSPNEWGTVAEWIGAVGAIIVGLVAAAFAGLAWKESKSATYWAEVAAEAQKRANRLTAREKPTGVAMAFIRGEKRGPTKLPDRFRTAFTKQIESPDVPTHIELSLDAESRPIYIYNVTLKLLEKATDDGTDTVSDKKEFIYTYRELSEKDEGPLELRPDLSIAVPDPYRKIHRGGQRGIRITAYAELTFSLTLADPQETTKSIQIDASELELS